MASLYELNARILTFEPEFDLDTGEWINETDLDALFAERNEKIEQLLLWAKNLRAESSAIKDEEKSLAERRKRKENLADRLEDHVARELNGEKFETPRVLVKWRKSEKVIILDESIVPDRFCSHEVVRKPDKMVIKQFLKSRLPEDEEIKWATLEVNNNMSVK